MSVLVSIVTPGLDAATYEAVLAALDRDQLPAGCTAHYAGPVEGGWRVVAVWDSAELAGDYGRTRVGPELAKHGLSGLPPEITPLHNSLT